MTSADDQVLWRWAWRLVRAWWPLLALAAAILIVAAVVAPAADTGLPLDPASTGPDGTRAVVAVLERLGRDVEVVEPGAADDADVVLVLRDQLTAAQRAALRSRVERGARVVVADPTSDLAPDIEGDLGLLGRILDRGCAVPALADVDQVAPGGGVTFAVPDDATGCFAVGDGAWLVVEPHGDGHIVSLGGPQALLNGELGRADHAVLVAQLLTPAGADRITVVRPVLRTTAEGGDTGLGDLVPGWVRAAAVQLGLAFLVLVLLRAGRVGAPLIDTSPVRLAGADQTRAVGALLARNGARAAAADRIADDTRRRIARHVGVPATSSVDDVAHAVAARTAGDPTRIARVLAPSAPVDDAALLRAQTDLGALEEAVRAALTNPVEPADVP
jgi:hypothetical protein